MLRMTPQCEPRRPGLISARRISSYRRDERHTHAISGRCGGCLGAMARGAARFDRGGGGRARPCRRGSGRGPARARGRHRARRDQGAAGGNGRDGRAKRHRSRPQPGGADRSAGAPARRHPRHGERAARRQRRRGGPAHVGEPLHPQRAPGADRRCAPKPRRAVVRGRHAARRARQQAGARRLRTGAHGEHHPRCAPRRLLRVPAHAVERAAPRLRDQPAQHGRARRRLQVPAGRLRGPAGGPRRRRAQGRREGRPRGGRAPCRRHRGEVPHPRRDAGHGADVRAIGVRSTPSCTRRFPTWCSGRTAPAS